MIIELVVKLLMNTHSVAAAVVALPFNSELHESMR